MLTVLIVIHLMLVIALIGVVLLQKSEGGGLISSTSGFLSSRGTANVLSRTTALLAAGFFVTSLVSVLVGEFSAPSGLDHQYRRSREPRSARRNAATAAIGPRRPSRRTAQSVAEGYSDAASRSWGRAGPTARAARAGWTAGPAIAISVGIPALPARASSTIAI